MGHISRDCKKCLVCEVCDQQHPTATFCCEHCMQRLNITGKRTHFLLKTMGQVKVVPTFAVSGMEVADLAGKSFYPLPEVLTQREMPVTPDNIVTAADLERWPYLFKVHISSIKANVDLLIGTNAPRLLEPWEVVNSSGYGPYAIRTVLGWVINGPLNGNCSNDDMKLSSVLNRISVSNLEIMLNNQYNHDFNERPPEEEEMSREDMMFMDIMETCATLQEGRYCLKLPFKRPDAKERILGLRKRFVSNPEFHREY